MNNTFLSRAFVVTSNQNHQKILLFHNIKILNKFKIFKHHRIGNFSSNIDLRKQDILSQEKISERSRFVNKDISQSLPMVNVCRCDFFGHIQIFRSYSFGHLELVK